MTSIEPEEQPEAAAPAPLAPDASVNGDGAHRARVAHAAAAARAQAAASRRARETERPAVIRSDFEREGTYAGLVTRALGYAVDIVMVNAVAAGVGVTVGLALSLLHQVPSTMEKALAIIGSIAYVLWLTGYFVTFWSTTGQTPGARIMRVRVIDARGAEHVKPLRALLRVVGLVLATIPLLAGFWMMLWDGRRRCLQDHMARTLVIHASPKPRIVRRPAD